MLLNLPSHYIPYNFKEVHLTDIKPKIIPLMAQAVEQNDFQYALDAVQTVIDTDVGYLTEGDFYYVLYVLRIKAFKRNMLVARWKCASDVFKRGDTGERWTQEQLTSYFNHWTNGNKEGMIDPDLIPVDVVRCDTENEANVEVDDLIVIELDKDAPYELDQRLDFPRARFIPESYVISEDPGIGSLVRVARWLRDGNTMMEKVQMITENMELYELALEAETKYRHGVTRNIVKHCSFCGEPNSLAMEVRPSSFF